MTHQTGAGDAWIIATLGGSDLAWDGESLDKPETIAGLDETTPASFRERCDEVLRRSSNATTALQRLTAPRIQPQVDFIRKRLPQAATARLILIATRQDPPHGKDTETAAALLKRQATTWWQLKTEIWTVPPATHITDLASTLRWLEGLLDQSAARLPASFWLATTGGTPALGHAVQLAFGSRFAGRCQAVYLPEGQLTRVDDTPAQVARLLRRQAVERLIERRDAAALADIEPHSAAGVLARAIDARYRLDWAALAALRQEQDNARLLGSDTKIDDHFRFEIEPLAARAPTDPQPELLENVREACRRRNWSDFLTALFRWDEFRLQRLVQAAWPGFPPPGQKGYEEDYRKAWRRVTPEQRSSVASQLQRDNKTLSDDPQPSAPTQLAMLAAGGTPPPRPEGMDSLRTLRNAIVHNTAAIDPHEIATAAGLPKSDDPAAAIMTWTASLPTDELPAVLAFDRSFALLGSTLGAR